MKNDMDPGGDAKKAKPASPEKSNSSTDSNENSLKAPPNPEIHKVCTVGENNKDETSRAHAPLQGEPATCLFKFIR